MIENDIIAKITLKKLKKVFAKHVCKHHSEQNETGSEKRSFIANTAVSDC